MSNLLAQGFGFVGALVPRLTDLFVSGNVVGVDALAAIAAIMPVTIGALFVGKLVCCGSGYLFAWSLWTRTSRRTPGTDPTSAITAL